MKKKKMPNGTYWDETLRRYVEPGDAAWREDAYRKITGDTLPLPKSWQKRSHA